MRKIHLINIIIIILLGSCAAGFARAEEEGENFSLPEAPPAVERKKLPSLDVPMLQKQDFIDDAEIEPPFIIHNKDFYSFGEQPGRVEAGFNAGGFSSWSGNLKFMSSDLWKINFKTYRTAGEFANQYREKNELGYVWQRPIGQRFYASVGLAATESLYWTQEKDHYMLESGFAWYPSETLNMKVNASVESSEVKDVQDHDEAVDGSYEVSFTPGANQYVSADFKKYSDSAYPGAGDFFDSDIVYGLTIKDSLLVKAGARIQRSDIFPEGGVCWNFLRGARLSVDYKIGTEKPSWSGLYMKDLYLRATPGIAWPKSTFYMSEALSYYFRDWASFKLDFSQGSWENYICMSQVAGTDYLAPVNANNAGGTYITGMNAEAMLKVGVLTGRFTGSKNYTPRLPMIPDYSYGAGLECGLPFWFTAGAGWDYISERSTVLGGDASLDPSQDIYVSLKKEFPEGIIVYAGCSNVLGDKIETQPGFFSKAPVFNAGLTVKFQ